MAASYSDVPPGGLLNIPPAIPQGMLYRVKQLGPGISKQTLKIVPLSGQQSATNGQKIIFALPPNSLVDLSTLEWNFTGVTQHRGNNAATNVANYVQKAYFPRNTASLIENLEVKCNGQSRQNINQYGYIFNILHDFTCGYDSVGKNRIGCNSDPSNKTVYNNGQMNRYAGFPLGNSSDNTLTVGNYNGFGDQDNYTVRTWLGLLGPNASTTIIDTSLYGDITIEITLAPSDVIMLSPTTPALTSYVSATNTEVNLSTAVGATAASTPVSYTHLTLPTIYSV